MSEVLLLNASYEPLRIVSLRRAMVLLMQRKAELIEAATQQLRSQRMIYVKASLQLTHFASLELTHPDH